VGGFAVYISIAMWYSWSYSRNQEEGGIMNRNQLEIRTKVTGNGIEVWGRNFWLKTGHCRRCENGLGHTMRRRGAGGERSSGLLLQRPGRYIWEDEIAPGEKPKLRRKVRHRENAAVRRLAAEEA
jgi:hypothetical protein